MSEDNRTITESDIRSAVELTPTKANIVLDSQLLSTLMTCPRLFDLRFNYNLQSNKGKSNSIECGSIIHKYEEVYYGSIIKGIARKEAHGFGMTAAEMYIRSCPHCTGFTATPEVPKPICGHQVDEYPGVQNTPVESEEWKTGWSFVLDTCEQYNKFYANDHWVPLFVETVKSKILYEDDELRILWKAKLDLAVDTNQGIFPVDHKTFKQTRKTLNLNNQFTGQCLIMGTRQVIINKIGLQKTLPPEKKFTREPVGYTSQRLLEWQGEILPFYGKLLLMYTQTGYWPPNLTSCEGKYGLCAFHEVCTSNPDMRAEEINLNFKVGPAWNPTNNDGGDE